MYSYTSQSFQVSAMKSSCPSLLIQPKTASSPPQLTTMEPVNTEIISQLSRRKLRGSPTDSESRKDKHNLRRLVLIQNSLVSISPCPSPSRSSPSTSQCLEFGCSEQADNHSPANGAHDDSSSSSGVINAYDDDGFGYVFPEMSLWTDSEEDEDEELMYGTSSLNMDAESDWLDAVLSDLDDPEPNPYHSQQQQQQQHDDDEYESALASNSQSYPLIQPPYASGLPPRYPLPRPSMHLELSPSHSDSDGPSSPPDSSPLHPYTSASLLDDFSQLPHLDADDGRSSIYSDSDESSEPATPLSHSLLRTGLPPFSVATHSSSAAGPSSSSSSQFSNSTPAAAAHSQHPHNLKRHSHHHHHHHVEVVPGTSSFEFSDDVENRTSGARAVVAVSNVSATEGPTRNSNVGEMVGMGDVDDDLVKHPHYHRLHHHHPHDYFSCNFGRRSFEESF